MIKLIRLEWKKNHILLCVRNAAVMVIILLLFLLMAANQLDSVETMDSYGKSMVGVSVSLFTHVCFIIFTSVMLASFLVNPFQNKTIHLMFSYPIPRKKIMLAQILAVWIFCFIALVLSKFFLNGMLAGLSSVLHISSEFVQLGSSAFIIETIVSSAAIISISFLALVAGMWTKSSKATIVAGIIIACLTQGNIGSYTLMDNVPFYCVLFALSGMAVFLVVRNIEAKDIV